ncbi:Co-chaperonin GroES [Rhizobium sp. CF122]|nr:Co-chaperonin GroES [Rhizobium sp. CF122]
MLKNFSSPLETPKIINQIDLNAMAKGSEPRVGFAPNAARRENLFVPEESDMTFRPLHDRILVRRIEAEEKTAGGIIIPDTAKEKPQEGEVVAAGPGARDDNGQLRPLDVKVGDRILFGKWSGTEIKLNGEDLLIMQESDVMGVIEVDAAARNAA